MPDVPLFLSQMIRLTKQGHIRWERIGPDVFHETSAGDAEVFVKSRNGDGRAPHVVVISSDGAPSTETTGDTDDPSYNEAFSELYAVASASALDGTPPRAAP